VLYKFSHYIIIIISQLSRLPSVGW